MCPTAPVTTTNCRPMHMDPCGTLLKRQDKEDEGTKGGTDGTSKRKLGSPSVAVSLPHKRGRPLSGVHVPGPQQQQQHVAQSAAAAAAAAAPATPAARSVCQAQLQQHRPSRIGTALHSPELSPSVVAAAEAHGPLLSELSLDTQRLQAVLQQQVAHQRAADGGEGAHFAALWRQAQGVVLQKTLRLLVRQLEAMPPPSTDNAKPTAGVSYVCPTESRQSGASGFSRLPHLGGCVGQALLLPRQPACLVAVQATGLTRLNCHICLALECASPDSSSRSLPAPRAQGSE